MSKRKLRSAIEIVSAIGSLGFDLQHHAEADISEAVTVLRTVNPEMFDWLVRILQPATAGRDGGVSPQAQAQLEAIELVANCLHDVVMVGWSPAVDAQRWAYDCETQLRDAIEKLRAEDISRFPESTLCPKTNQGLEPLPHSYRCEYCGQHLAQKNEASGAAVCTPEENDRIEAQIAHDAELFEAGRQHGITHYPFGAGQAAGAGGSVSPLTLEILDDYLRLVQAGHIGPGRLAWSSAAIEAHIAAVRAGGVPPQVVSDPMRDGLRSVLVLFPDAHMVVPTLWEALETLLRRGGFDAPDIAAVRAGGLSPTTKEPT